MLENEKYKYNIQIFTQNFIQRLLFLYWIKQAKYQRYEGKKVEWSKIDELGQIYQIEKPKQIVVK